MTVYQLGLYEKAMPSDLSWTEKLEIAHKAGFDHLEISIDETDAKLARLYWTDEQRAELAAAIRSAGVPIRSICLSVHRKYSMGSHDPKIRARGMEIMDRAIALAEYLGIRIIQLAGYDVYYEVGDQETRRFYADNLAISVEHAAAKGIMLGFETMETPFMDTVEKAMEYVNSVNSPYLGVYPDLGNLKNAALIYNGDVNKDLETGRGHIMAVHIKETIPGHYREIPFGTGHTEYARNFDLLRDMGIRMFVGEFWYTGQKTWQEELLLANTFLRGKLDAAFGKEND